MLTILITEFVRRPNAALASAAVDGIDKAEALGLFSIRPAVIGIAQQTRGHARPQSEDDKGDEVAHGHCSASGFIQRRSGG